MVIFSLRAWGNMREVIFILRLGIYVHVQYLG